jgi:hypothetical protein
VHPRLHPTQPLLRRCKRRVEREGRPERCTRLSVARGETAEHRAVGVEQRRVVPPLLIGVMHHGDDSITCRQHHSPHTLPLNGQQGSNTMRGSPASHTHPAGAWDGQSTLVPAPSHKIDYQYRHRRNT